MDTRLESLFEKAASDIRRLKETPNEDDLIEIYGLYKQATIGDINTDRSLLGLADLKGRAKWEAWKLWKGMGKDEAMKLYITKAEKLIEKIGLKLY